MFKKVAPYVGEYKKYTVWAAIMMSLGIIANVIPYFFLYQIIAPISRGEHIDLSFIMIRVAGTLVCEVVYALAYVQGLTFSHISAYNTLKNLRISLQGKLEKQSLGNIQKLGTGRIKKIFTDDIDQIELLLAHAIPEGIANIFVPLLIIVLMFIVNWKLGLLSLVPLVAGMFAMGMMMKAGLEKMNAYYESAAKMNNTIIEYINGMEVVKVFNKDGDSYKRFGEVVRNYRDFTIAWYKVCWPWMAVYSSILPCLALLMLPVGALMVLNGAVTLDKLILVICMSFSVGPSFLKALGFAGKIPQLDYKITELENLLEKPPLKEGTSEFKGINRDVSFENVRFTYEDKEVLHGVSLELKQGTTTALVGESGSGKSTVASLVMGRNHTESGTITIGGRELQNVSEESLMRLITYIGSGSVFFKGTVRENLLPADRDADDEKLWQVLSECALSDYLMSEQGLDTRLTENAGNLSGGQKQRLALARAILHDSPVMIFDEATSNIDVESEEAILEEIRLLSKNKTVIMISHRMANVVSADRIYCMEDGCIAESGTHEELLKKNGTYAKLWRTQAALEQYGKEAAV